MATAASQPRRGARENNFTDIGVAGRKTGFTVQATERDVNGMEDMAAFFSSPEKSAPASPVTSMAMNQTETEASMQIASSSGIEPTEVLAKSAARIRQVSLPPRARSPAKFSVSGTPRRASSVALLSSPIRSSPVRPTVPTPSRRLDFSMSERANLVPSAVKLAPQVNGNTKTPPASSAQAESSRQGAARGRAHQQLEDIQDEEEEDMVEETQPTPQPQKKKQKRGLVSKKSPVVKKKAFSFDMDEDEDEENDSLVTTTRDAIDEAASQTLEEITMGSQIQPENTIFDTEEDTTMLDATQLDEEEEAEPTPKQTKGRWAASARAKEPKPAKSEKPKAIEKDVVPAAKPVEKKKKQVDEPAEEPPAKEKTTKKPKAPAKEKPPAKEKEVTRKTTTKGKGKKVVEEPESENDDAESESEPEPEPVPKTKKAPKTAATKKVTKEAPAPAPSKPAKVQSRKPKQPAKAIYESPNDTDADELERTAEEEREDVSPPPPAAKKARTAKKPAVEVEEEEAPQPVRKKGRPAAAPKKSAKEDEGQEDEEEAPQPARKKARTATTTKKPATTKKSAPKKATPSSPPPAAPKPSARNERAISEDRIGRQRIIHEAPPQPTQDLEDEGKRRSARAKIAPLAFWKNEKIKYTLGARRKSGPALPQIAEIIRVEEDPESPKPRASRAKSGSVAPGNKRKRAAKDDDNDAEVGGEEPWESLKNASGEVGVKVGLVRPYPLQELGETIEAEIAYSCERITTAEVANNDFRFVKTCTRDHFGTGIIVMRPGEQKRPKNSGKMFLVFYIATGRASVTIADTSFRIGKGGQFMVPPGNMYSIVNEFDVDLRLFFAQGAQLPQEYDDDEE